MKPLSFSRYLLGSILLALLLLPVEASFAIGPTCNVPNCPEGCGGGSANPVFIRTFNPGHHAKHATAGFELTREDFLRLYAIGREVHINLSHVDSLYQMHIGFQDLDNAQSWQLPKIAYDGPSIWAIIDPTAAPYRSLFPQATHVLTSDNDQLNEGTVYLFYNVAETALVLLGEVVEPPGGGTPETTRYDFPIALFPLNETLLMQREAQVDYDGVQAKRIETANMHGFGSLKLNDQETITAAAFIDDYVFRDINEPDPNQLLTFETRYNLIGDDGTQFSFFIADPPSGDSTAIDGDVFIEYVEYWRVVDPITTAIETETPPEGRTWSVYPNPATDEIRFSAPTNVVLYDVLGREVGKGKAVQRLDVRSLTPGLYLVRSDVGESKTVIVQ